MELHIGFGGFYDSLHSDVIDCQIERDYEYFSESQKWDITGDDHWDSVVWSETNESYGKAYIDRLNNKLDLNLKFKGIFSPKFYNYSTDKLIVDISDSDIDFIMEDIHNINFVDYVNDRLKSRDGFKSYYDDGNKTPFDNLFLNAFDYDNEAYEHLLELYIEWMIENNDINEFIYDLEFEVEYK